MEDEKVIKEQIQRLNEKIMELEMDSEEFSVVLSALQSMPSEKKCFRKISGILVESTVSETIPDLESTQNGVGYYNLLFYFID